MPLEREKRHMRPISTCQLVQRAAELAAVLERAFPRAAGCRRAAGGPGCGTGPWSGSFGDQYRHQLLLEVMDRRDRRLAGKVGVEPPGLGLRQVAGMLLQESERVRVWP